MFLGFYDLCRTLKKYCMEKKYSFLFIDYSYEDHLRKLNFDLKALKQHLKIYNDEDPTRCVLMYLAERGMIFNIRYTDGTDREGIIEAVRRAQDEAKLFCALHHDSLIGSSLNFVR